MKKKLALLILLCCSFSCAPLKKEVITKSTMKFEGKNTNIRDIMEIDGYYYMLEDPDGSCCMFFEDGTWVVFSFKRNITNDEKKANMSKSVKSWIEGKQLRWGSYWGIYKIEGDTLIVYRYDEGCFWKAWSIAEDKYKIIDKNTIQRIYYRGLLKVDDSYYETHSPWIFGGNFRFVPADSLPSSDCWLKENRWIWRNEPDWKVYMERIKQNIQK